MNDTEKHTALILRKFRRKLPISEFASAQLSPDLSFIAFKSLEDKLTLYKLKDIEDDIIPVKQIEIKKCERCEWIRSAISSCVLLVTQVKSGAIIIHQFSTTNNVIILDEDTTVRPISIEDLAQADNYSEKIIEFRKNSDNAVLRYKIPMVNVEKILGNYLYQEANQVETISSVKLIGCSQDYIILHLNHNTLLVLQIAEDILRVKSVIRTEDAKAKIITATLHDGWIFFLESTNRVLIFNMSGAQRGTVELNNIKTPNQLTTSNEYVTFSVSQDLSTLVAVTSRGSVLAVALDVLFREQPTNWKDLPRTDDDDTHDDNMSSDTTLLRWFDHSKPRPASLPRPWKPLRPVHFNMPKHVYNTSAIYLGDNEIRPNLALNGWNARKTPQPKSISQSAQFLPALVDGNVESVEVNATHIVIIVRSEAAVMCCFYSRENGDAHSLELQNSVPLRVPGRMMFYFIDESSLCVLCMDRTRSKITNDLIIFTTPILAERLYELNSWDRRTLRLHALKMGLRYRQLDVIEPVLQSLDPDQQLTGGHILLDFIKQHTMTVQDEVFWDQLLRIGMNFVSLIIDQKSSQAISRLAVSSSTSQVDQDLYGEMMTISKVLDELRQFKINLRHLSMSKTVAADDILYSPWSVAKSKRKSRDETEQVSRLGRIRPRVLFESGTSPTDLEDYPSAPVTPPRDEDDTNDGPSSPTRTPQVKERDEEEEARELASSQSLEDLDELALSFGNYRHLWERQSDVQVVQHALVNCNPSLALSYLKWRYQSQGRTMTDMTRSGAVVDIDFNYVKRISEPVIYHAVCQNQFELARKMINSIGEDVDSHFKNIAWKTLRRDVRNVILTYLNDNNKLNEHEHELIRFLHQLEQFYPNHKYDMARLAAMKQRPKLTSEQQSTDLTSLDDLPPKIQSELRSAGIEVNTNDAGNVNQEPHDSATYGQWRLTWIDQWDLQTKLRVIVEAALMTDTNTRGEFTQDKQEKDFLSQLSFYLSHNMWRKLSSWVHDINLSGYVVNPKGKLERKSSEDDDDDKHYMDLIKLIEDVLPQEIRYAAGFVKEMLYNELAAVGIFTKEETDTTFNGAKTKILPPVLERLAKVNQLFGDIDGAKNRKIPQDQMLPYGHIAPLHVLFVRYCILNELYSILTAYLDTYQLATTEEQVNEMISELNKLFDTPLDQDVNRRWARLLFSFRAHKNLFELSILNAKAWFKVPANKEKSFSVNSMFASQSREKRPLMALSTLMYAPMQLRDIWNGGKGDVHYVDKAQMNDFLKKYPLLREVFFPETDNKPKKKSAHDVSAIITPTRRLNLLSGRRDINLYALLQNEPFSVDKILQPNKDATSKVLSFNDAEFDSERFVDNIDIPYYLVNGQPFHAYHLLMSKGRAALQPDEFEEDTNKSTSLSIEEMMLLMKVVKVTAFLHMFDDTVVAACVSFLELCDMSNEELTIDIEAARRIYQFKAALQQVKADDGPNEQILEEVILPFLSINKDQGDQTLKEILVQLEESTASMPQPEENTSDKTNEQSDANTDDQVLKLNNKWHLVTQFCRVHKLTLNDAPLIELAQQNDWVRFLYEAQALHYPGEQVLRIVNKYFTDVSLRQHLITCVKQMEAERGTFVTQQNEEEVQSSDLFELINQARNQVHPGETLLKYAQKFRRPLLAVIAQCFPDVTPLNCMIVWLYASFPTDYFKAFDTPSTENNESPTILKRKSKDKTIITQGKKVVWSLDSLDTLGRLISILCVKKQFIHLLRAFQLFEPGHLMVHWIKFLQAFVQYRYEEALGHAKQFVTNWRQPPFPLLFKIGDTDWIERWVREESEQSMMSHIQTPYELGHLLRVLSTVNLHAKYKTLETTCALLSNAGLVDLLFDKDTKSFALPPAETIVNRLAESGLFDDARTVAIANELDVDTITVQQAQHTLKQFSLSHFWNIAAERIEIWKKVNELFVQYKTSPLVAGDFFYQSAEDMRTEPTSSLTVENLAAEKIFLLSLALSWFNGEFNEQIDQHPPASGSGQEKSEAWKHAEVLQEIEAKMIQVSVASHIPHDISKMGKLPNIETPSMTTEALEQIIGRLINESGNFAEVEKVCRQFKHESSELVLARTIASLAERTLTPADMPESIKALYEERYGPKNFDDYDLNELAELLDRLVGLSHHAKQFCERIVVKYKVAQVLSLSFEEINTKDPYEVLRFVLVEGPKKYSLAKSFIVLNQLDAIKVAHVLADGCFQSLTSPDWSTVGAIGATPMSPMPSSGPSSEHSSMKEADFNSPMKRVPSQSDFDAALSPTPGRTNSAAKIVANVWSARHFSEYVMLCGLPEEVGKELLRHFEMTVYSIPLQAEVDLLIRAHFCFSLAHQIQGTNHILAIVKGRVQQEYVKQKQFKLLVRLITGTKEYTNMQYILDLLVQFNCFEMLLSKNIYIEDDNDKKELQVSLYVFLKTKYPQEIGLMKLLFLRFQMYREYADYSVEKAKEELQSVQSENKPKARVAIHEQSALLTAMASYLDAADYYTKSHCMQMSAQALMQAALIQLQLENLDANVMNLSLDEARKVIMFKGSFVECLVIANAYGLNASVEWIAPLYQQVIVLGNFEFMDDYLTNLPLTSELFRDVVKKYKADPQKNQYQMQIRRFLEYLDDFHLRHQIAIDLGFRDVATAIINLKGLDYFINAKE